MAAKAPRETRLHETISVLLHAHQQRLTPTRKLIVDVLSYSRDQVVTIALGVFFPTVINTYSAVDAVPRNLIRMSQSFDLPWPLILWKVMLPATLPGLLAAFRISASIALILLVAAEMIGADYGIGAIIIAAGNLMQTDQLVAGVVILSLLGLGISWIIGRLERRLLRWR